jgi:acyl-CoA synthetase (AMP-forming)/AMP-acid ligase II
MVEKQGTKVEKQGLKAAIEPFDMSGIARRADGVLAYSGLASSVVEMLSVSVERYGDREAVVEDGGERLTYKQLWDRSRLVAGGLVQEGVKPKDRVAIRLGNGVDWCVALFASMMAGAIAVPVNTRLSEPEVAYVLDDSQARYVFEPGRAMPQGPPTLREDLQPGDPAAIFYTSGTTGFPKGAVTTHENFLSNVETCRRLMDLPEAELRNLVSVPLFHVTGCNSQLLPTLRLGGTTVVMASFDVQRFLAVSVEERINLVTSVPAILWLAMTQPNFADFDLSGIRWVTYGGAPTPPEQVARMLEAFPNAKLGNGFGLTETSSVATFLPHDWAHSRAETVGFAAPPVELDLADVDPATGAGELLVRGPNVVAGYWGKPEATAEAFVGGWLHTGDIARVDSDGFCQIVDRKKDMVNRGGENVYCVEVENALVCHPDVFEVAVVGVPDTMMGEKVGAVVVPRPGRSIDPAELVSFARTRLADFKVPQYVVVRPDPLPRNPGGKVLKASVRDQADWGRPLR